MAASVIFLCLMVFLSVSESREIPLSLLNFKESFIIGGDKVKSDLAPYQVSIQNTFGDHVCGGSIIDELWILTAAHCMDWPIKYLKVVTGTTAWQKPGAEYIIAESKTHCKFNDPWYSNDIALLRLSKPIVFNSNTKPIKLATSSDNLKNGDKLVLTGWGSVTTWGRSSVDLQKVILKYLDYKKCQSSVRNRSWLHAGHICSYTKAGEGACTGDSGGPLVDANQVQVGVVNWGEPCAVGYPDVYASVSYYKDWITSTMNGQRNECS